MGGGAIANEFADVLRRLRLAANLSQEELAERAGLSVDAIGAYERGLRRSPRRETLAVLVEALDLEGPARASFEGAARLRHAGVSPAANGPDHNLPWQSTSFVGRQRELDELTEILDQTRLATITGTGGIGKTRIAIEVASRLLQRSRKQVYFVDLAPVVDDAMLPDKLASAIGIELQRENDLVAGLVLALKEREVLLVLDNCEHVIVAARALVNAILRGCPRVSILATSRERLGIAAERTYCLRPLSASAALALFAERATTAEHDFTISNEDVPVAREICRRLDGIALAIELAAARLPMLGFSVLQAQLDEQFGVIGGGHHDLPPRQRTLRATIAWSHDLLDDCERVLFRRLAIFANGWTLEAAERVCTGEVLERAAVLDALLSLVTKSLVLVDLDAPLPRYYFFESTRAFALEQLGASGEYDSVARAHAQWMATFAEHCLSRAHETGGKWHTEAAPEIENVLAALAWAFSSGGDAVLGARVAANLEWGWMRAAFAEQGIRYMNAALARLDAQEHPALVGRLMLAQCGAAANHFDVDRLRQTVALLASDANVCLVAKAHGMLAQALSVSGASDEAVAVSDKAFELLREAKLESSAAYARHLELRGLILCFRPGRLEEARTCVAEAVELAHALGSNSLVMILQHTFAQFEFLTGDAASAAALVASSLNAARAERGWLSGSEIGALSNLASYQLALGEIDAAQASAREALTLAHPARDVAAHMAIQHLAAVAALRSELRTAARLLGYVNNWLARMPESRTRDPIDQSSYDILTASLRRQLTDEEATALMAKGALLSQDAAVAEALALTSEPLATG